MKYFQSETDATDVREYDDSQDVASIEALRKAQFNQQQATANEAADEDAERDEDGNVAFEFKFNEADYETTLTGFKVISEDVYHEVVKANEKTAADDQAIADKAAESWAENLKAAKIAAATGSATPEQAELVADPTGYYARLVDKLRKKAA